MSAGWNLRIAGTETGPWPWDVTSGLVVPFVHPTDKAGRQPDMAKGRLKPRRSTVSTKKKSLDADGKFDELATDAETGCSSVLRVRVQELEDD